MYGPRWEFALPSDPTTTVIMRPAQLPADAEELARLLQDPVVLDFVSLDHSPTANEELEHFEKVGQDKSFHWMIAVRTQDGTESLVGVSGLHVSEYFGESRRLSSGILLANRAWWGRGVASATHRLRTWHAFNVQGAFAINSCFIEGNDGSGRALAGVGYTQVGRNERSHLVNGQWRDEVLLTCYNPAALPVMWPDGDVPEYILKAVEKTKQALEWAKDILAPR